MFYLHPQLDKDCIVVGDFPLCRLLLSKDSRYPWFILVPRKQDITEIFELSESDQAQLSRESIHLSRTLHQVYEADKLNVAALGNMVSQLHIHHIVRYHGDDAWPAPVWGRLPAKAYEPGDIAKRLEPLRLALREDFKFAETAS